MPIIFAQELLQFIDIFFRILTIAIFIRCFLSFFPVSRDNAFVNIIVLVTEPILGPLRVIYQRSPLGGGSVDFSPIIALILMNIVELFLKSLVGFILISI